MIMRLNVDKIILSLSFLLLISGCVNLKQLNKDIYKSQKQLSQQFEFNCDANVFYTNRESIFKNRFYLFLLPKNDNIYFIDKNYTESYNPIGTCVSSIIVKKTIISSVPYIKKQKKKFNIYGTNVEKLANENFFIYDVLYNQDSILVKNKQDSLPYYSRDPSRILTYVKFTNNRKYKITSYYICGYPDKLIFEEINFLEKNKK